MCEIQMLKALVEQILTAAAEEIFGVFKRSIAEIEEKLSDSPKHKKRKKRLPDAVHQTDTLIPPEQQGRSPHVDQEDPEPPRIKKDQEEERTMKLTLLSECPTPIRTLWTVKAEPSLEQQDRSPSLNQLDPEPPHTKEEENLWTNQEGERLQGLEKAHIATFPSTPSRVKSKYDEDKAQSSQLQSQTKEDTEEPEDGDDYRGSEPDSIQNNDFPISDAACQTTQHQCTEDDKTCLFLSVSETQVTVHSTKKTFRCSVCNKGFANQSEFMHHMSLHTREKPFSCSVCKKDFAHRGSLNRHMLVHTGERPFSCSVCHKGFTRKFEVKQHMLTHTRKKASIH